MLLWAKVRTSRCCITLNNFDRNSDHELIIQSLVIEVEFIAWSNMITCCVILAIFWPKIDRHLITIVPSSFKCAECEVKCHLVWNTLITFDHPQNPFWHIWSRLEEVVVKSDQDEKKSWSRKFWNSVIGAAEGRKFSDWDTFGPLPELREKEPKKPNGC